MSFPVRRVAYTNELQLRLLQLPISIGGRKFRAPSLVTMIADFLSASCEGVRTGYREATR